MLWNRQLSRHRGTHRRRRVPGLAGAVLAIACALPTMNSALAHDLEGAVTGPDGKPLADVNVHVVRKTWPGGRYRQDALTGRTDTDGIFRFQDFHQPGERVFAMVTVCEPGYLLTGEYLRNPTGGEFAGVRLALGKAEPVTFVLRSAEGKPLANTSVVPQARAADGREHTLYSVSSRGLAKTTNAAGEVTFDVFGPGQTARLLVVSASGNLSVSARIGEGRRAELTVGAGRPSGREPAAPAWPKPQASSPAHVSWVRENSVPFRTIDPADEDFSDLLPLKEMIGDASVVMLGEQSHGDGTCFETKIRLIKFLHQEMDFDVLAFESGLYDCSVAWRKLRAGESALAASQQGVFGIWTGSEQVRPLLDYLSQHARGERPLELAGVDCQFTGRGSLGLVDALTQFAAGLKPSAIEPDRLQELLHNLERLVAGKPAVGKLSQFVGDLTELAGAADNVAQEKKDRSALFWAQVLRSLRSQATNSWRGRGGPTMGAGQRRDRQMGENLVWLARDFYAGRKIVVWAASYHTMRNPKTIDVPSGAVSYKNTMTMGDYACRQLGDRVFSVMFTTHEGKAGPWMRPPRSLAPAPEGTLEDIFRQAGVTNGMLSLRSDDTGATWLRQPLAARPLGYLYMQANWSDVFDAVVFNRTMRPSTRAK